MMSLRRKNSLQDSYQQKFKTQLNMPGKNIKIKKIVSRPVGEEKSVSNRKKEKEKK